MLKDLSGFKNLAAFDTTGANTLAGIAASWQLNPNRLQIGVKAAARAVVRVRDIVAELRAFATGFTAFSHCLINLRRCRAQPINCLRR